ncbi:collagen-like domain-containing protein [Butyrivibrio hungatei]|uniref:Cell surface protein n=1 Tax=Butyrivibrio hungatei TaxID=185008 RepID=A0A1D9P5K9_9FIRM|nr:collagen-like protein [Butyrivibrio hungatei]AOZ97821.1 cell surface protein [Butyrivibrio hungatei]
MGNFIENLKDRFEEFKNNPENKKKFIAAATVVGALALILVVCLASGLKSISLKQGGASAGDLIEGNSPNVERNAAGGIILDIDWDNVIGYDLDGNPVYGTNGMVSAVGGYDMLGAPILADDMKVIGNAEDGLPIYDYSAIEQARLRGLNDITNTNIDWNTVVGYDKDGNPIFGTFGADPNILGYDAAGNPIYKGSVTVTGRTDSGMPIYDYSTRETVKAAGKSAQDRIRNGKNGADGKDGVDASATDGNAGINGSNGANGTSGTNGTNRTVTQIINNTSGKDGTNGTSKNGTNGTNGINANGTNGTNGTNADVSRVQAEVDALKEQVNNGSLNGKDGRDGKDGEKGERGSEGQRGATGAQGSAGQTGSQGATGATGAQGAAGKDGVTYYTYIRYASEDPSVYSNAKMSADPSSDTKYMGIATSASTSAPAKASDYTWSQYKDLSVTATTDADGVTTLVIH